MKITKRKVEGICGAVLKMNTLLLKDKLIKDAKVIL